MGILIDGNPVADESDPLKNLQSFLKDYQSSFEDGSTGLKNRETKSISNNDATLYVNQREFAVLNGKDSSKITSMGTDMSTTCHMVVLYCKAPKVAALGHFDGACTMQGVNDMVDCTLLEVVHQCPDINAVDLDLRIVGGFEDDRKLSEQLSIDLLREFHRYSTKSELPQVRINLKTFCATTLNNIKSERSSVTEEGQIIVDSPSILGVTFDVKTGDLCPAVFEENAKVPVPDLRSSRSLCGVQNMPNIYRTEDDCFVLQPFTCRRMEGVEMWLSAPDHIIRRYMSTSPEVEPDNFEEHIRSTLRYIYENPDPLQSVFQNETKPLVFQAEIVDNKLQWRQK